MKFNVQRWETRSRWLRLKLRVLFLLGFDPRRLRSVPEDGTVRVAKLHTLIQGRFAYNVYAYVSTSPVLLKGSTVAFLTSRK